MRPALLLSHINEEATQCGSQEFGSDVAINEISAVQYEFPSTTYVDTM